MYKSEIEFIDFLDKIKSVKVLNELGENLLKEIEIDAKYIKLADSEILFNKGESYHKGIYFIIDGEIKLVDDTYNILEVLGKGGLVGLTTFLGKSSYAASGIAGGQTSLLFIPEITIYKLINASESFSKYFYSIVNDRLHLFQNKDSSFSKSLTYKPVGNYMTFPIISVEKDLPIIDASKIMSSSKVGSLIITDNSTLIGILTAKSLVHNFLPNADKYGLNATIYDFIDKDIIKVPKEYPLVEVLAEMQAKNKEYAVIVKNEKPIGIISNKDIIKILYNSINVYTAHIESTKSLDNLRDSYLNLHKVADELIESSRMTADVLPMISSIHLAIQKQVHKITVDEFYKKSGINVCNIKHALIIMGSGARKEMMLDPDQDNGFIFDNDITQTEKSILMEFGKKFVDNLAYVGYKKCPGNVMVTNPNMSKTLREWKKSIAEIVNDPSSDGGFLKSSIVFDMDIFCGNDNLVWELKEFIFELIAEKPIFLIQFLENDTNFKSPVSFFGKFIVEKEGENKDKLNLKPYALSIVVDVTRAYTLAKKLSSLNTIERLKHLERKHILSDETVGKVTKAYEIVVDIVLRNQIKSAKKGEKVNKYINPAGLSTYNQNRLKNALNTITKYLNNSLKYFKGHA